MAQGQVNYRELKTEESALPGKKANNGKYPPGSRANTGEIRLEELKQDLAELEASPESIQEKRYKRTDALLTEMHRLQTEQEKILLK